MRCWTERDQGGDPDPLGGGEDWQPHLSQVPCNWWVASGREVVDAQRSVVLADEHVMLDRTADVKAGDRIVQVVDHKGRTVFEAGDFREVEHVAVERDFIDCSLRSSS